MFVYKIYHTPTGLFYKGGGMKLGVNHGYYHKVTDQYTRYDKHSPEDAIKLCFSKKRKNVVRETSCETSY